MLRYLLFAVALLLFSNSASIAQDSRKKKEVKRKVYFTWGWNKDWFSQSNLHFSDPTTGYNFTLYHVTAHDRPQYLDITLNLAYISTPQYGYRLGWYFKNHPNDGIEINFDHTKYVMDSVQLVHLKGTIYESYYDVDTIITKSFLKFEHTNGANFYLLNYFKSIPLFLRKNISITAFGKGGAGVVIPKTDVTLFGHRLDNRYHVAGWLVGLESDVRVMFFSHVYIEGGAKVAFADYMNVLVMGDGHAHHSFGALEAIWGIGYQASF